MRRKLILAGIMTLAILAGSAVIAFAQPLSGAIFTTDSACSGVDLNIYGSKDAVYLNGGPAHPGAAGLPDGSYYVKVTEPGGALLGTSVGSTNPTPVSVHNGEFDQCYQLSSIVGTPNDPTQAGYNDTSSPGGEYKVWVSTDQNFANDSSKTDNFKVKPQEGGGPPPQATLHVLKYYDVNANGTYDDGIDTYLPFWQFRIHDHIDWIRETPTTMILDPEIYHVSEYKPIQTNWVETEPSSGTLDNAPSNEVPPVPATGTRVQDVDLSQSGAEQTVQFGNVCLGGGGGLTLGFWSNNNGKKLYGSDDNALLVSLNLVQNSAKKNSGTLQGVAFDPAGYSAYQSWLLKAESTNMAYMLSAQLSAMELNVLNGKVGGGALIYAPGTNSANPQGFATVNAVMTEANAELGAHPTTVAAGATRTYQESLMKALDGANNNLNFVQSSACPYSFQ